MTKDKQSSEKVFLSDVVFVRSPFLFQVQYLIKDDQIMIIESHSSAQFLRAFNELTNYVSIIYK